MSTLKLVCLIICSSSNLIFIFYFFLSSSTKSNVPSLRNKELSKSSRRSTRQVSKFKQDRNELIIQRSAAYAEALRRLNSSSPKNVRNKKKRISIAQVARDVSEEFEFEVRADTLRKLKREKKDGFLGSGRPSSFKDNDLQAISNGLISWLTIAQINGDAEKKPAQSQMHTAVQNGYGVSFGI